MVVYTNKVMGKSSGSSLTEQLGFDILGRDFRHLTHEFPAVALILAQWNAMVSADLRSVDVAIGDPA